MLQHITVKNFTATSGITQDFVLSYQLFGRNLHTAPIVMVNHALTGNSDCAGNDGWWKQIIGNGQVIDLQKYTVICFNIPGNGYDDFFIENYKDFVAADIANLFLEALKLLKISKLHTLIGGSLGGAIAWEMLAKQPDLAENFVPIAADYRTSDWLHAQCLVQSFLLNDAENPLQKARIHAMLCYRTPESLNFRFKNEIDAERQILKSQSWLDFHGERLSERFSLQAYRLVNQLLMTINANEIAIRKITAKILVVAINSDLLFPASESARCCAFLYENLSDVSYSEIKSIHGHDAFLIEYQQLEKILKPIFMKQEIRIVEHKAMVNFEGKDFFGKLGIDARIFKVLNEAGISVGVISQQVVERGVSVLVDENQSAHAVEVLSKEFENELKNGEVDRIYAQNGLCAIHIQTDKKDLNKILDALDRNKVATPLLNQQAASGRINFIVEARQKNLAKKIVEAEVFDEEKTVNLALIGHGTVGKALIDQILTSAEDIRRRKKINFKIVAVANSKKMLLDENGIDENWAEKISKSSKNTDRKSLLEFFKNHELVNPVLVDNTASRDFVAGYPEFAENGFDLVSSNKIFNTLPISEYQNFRKLLEKNNKKYLYETNVGAGLPLIDTIKLLHLSGENITRIKGVFSGSLSYIFNNFSVRDEKFSTIVKEAMDKGFTEPDPREDLSGNDVARKLLILARELDLVNEFEDINIKNLVPELLQHLEKSEFISRLTDLDEEFSKIKSSQENEYVLRYVGDLHGDLQQEKGELDVKLVSVPASSALGQLKGSDSIFEIYTESYGENPIVIMGAGAGAKVTARGVFGDILRLSETK